MVSPFRLDRLPALGWRHAIGNTPGLEADLLHAFIDGSELFGELADRGDLLVVPVLAQIEVAAQPGDEHHRKDVAAAQEPGGSTSLPPAFGRGCVH